MPHHPHGSHAVPTSLAALAEQLRDLPPSCGPVRLVAVDGHAGSGKTTFAALLTRALGGAPIVHLDDLATHEQLFEWTVRLVDGVLLPLSRGETARFRAYDWTARRFAEERVVPAAPVVLVEGVGAGRRALRPRLARLLWMDLPAAAAHARGEARDGPALAGFWREWRKAETAHFSADPSRPFADLLVDGVDMSPRPNPYRAVGNVR
ncbi:hypothetical protein [Streptacidiphilus carbonis]|uniref:hypothetical protein n=1 Tax=Streptacidiphilus carbonis TaxID=105422 RepID=UPI0005A964A9|nr:hypothetical protein [Streptacidiphilus carbonis]